MRIVLALSFVTILGLAGAFPANATTMLAPSACDATVGNLVTNCGFETSLLTPWTVGGNVTNPPGGFNGSEYGIDAGDARTGNDGFYAGPAGAAMSLSQNLSLLPNTTYNIRFWLEQDTVNTDPTDYTHAFQASFDGTVLMGLMNPAAAGSFVSYTFVVTTGATVVTPSLQFAFRNDDSYWSLDDVNVIQATSTVPEPASFLLMGTSMAMLGISLARKRKNNKG